MRCVHALVPASGAGRPCVTVTEISVQPFSRTLGFSPCLCGRSTHRAHRSCCRLQARCLACMYKHTAHVRRMLQVGAPGHGSSKQWKRAAQLSATKWGLAMHRHVPHPILFDPIEENNSIYSCGSSREFSPRPSGEGGRLGRGWGGQWRRSDVPPAGAVSEGARGPTGCATRTQHRKGPQAPEHL